MLSDAVKKGATDALITHIGQLETVLSFGLKAHGDFRLNIFNSAAARYCVSEGMTEVMLSPELTLPQMRDISAPKSAIVYGRLPIMLLTKPLGSGALTDATGAKFPVIKEAGLEILLNSVPVYMADRQKELRDSGIIGQHFIFTTESRMQCEEIVESYKNGKAPSFKKFRRILK